MNARCRAGSVMVMVMVMVMASVMLSGSARATPVLSNIASSFSNGYGFNSPTTVGLGFTSGTSAGQIDGLSLSLMSGLTNTSQSITFSVYLFAAGSNNLPTGAALSQDDNLSATWTNPVGGSFQQQTFSYTAASLPHLFAETLSPNTKYVLAIGQSTGSPIYEQYWAVTSTAYTTNEGYAFTTMSRSTDNLASWSAVASNKPIAEISVASVPEPSVTAMVAVAAAGWVVVRRRRA